jgi:aspartyl-tRNA(Asn)/glutamyl-tRNA(Gln) amidotransferase subunit A
VAHPPFTLARATELLRTRQASSVELTRQCLARVHAAEPNLGAFLSITEEHALKQARAADERLARGDNVGPLTGVPYAVKDCLNTVGLRTTCASKILREYVSPYDATVIRKLNDAGAVMVGKLNMDEFGMGSSCENSGYFPCKNPWDHGRVPGGSSGGSGAAVAADLVPFTLGEDTGGSIRMPAAFCGVVGLKSTYGRVSRYGLLALSSSFDSIGPMAWTVEDVAQVTRVIAGRDPLDSTSLDAPVPDYKAQFTGTDLKGVRLGLPKEYFTEGMQPGVEKALLAAIDHLKGLGATVREVSLPHTKYAMPVYYTVQFAEASTNLARYDGVRFRTAAEADDLLNLYLKTRADGFGPEVKRRILLGTYVLSVGHYDAYYLKAQQVRELMRRDFERAFEMCDALVTPVAPTTAFKFGEKTNDPLAMYLSDIYVTAVNPSGVPGISVPCGFADGLPVGMQLIGPRLGEPMLFRIGHAYQQSSDWHLRRPNPEATA